MFTLFSAAMAMDCTGLDATLCEVVDDLEFRIEGIEGSDVIGDDKAARFQPLSIYNQLDAAREAIGDDGCRSDETFAGYEGGVLAYGFPGGSFEGSWSADLDEGTTDGSVNVRRKAFWGDFDGDDTGVIGDSLGRFKNMRVAGSRDDGFMIGHWIRIQGRRGVYVTLFGQCDDGQQIDTSFQSWFGSALEATCPDEDTVLSWSNGTCLGCGDGYTLDTDPAIYWRLNETSGTTATNLGNLGAASDGTYVGSVVLDQPGVGDDSSVGFGADNVNRVRDLTSAFGTGSELTTSIWVNTSNTTDSASISYAVSGQNNEFLIFRTTNIRIYLENQTFDTGANIADGDWHHIVVTVVDNSSLEVFVDAVSVGTFSHTRTVSPGGALVLGQEQDSIDGGFAGAQRWIGELDEFASWDRILSDNEIENLYRSATCSI